MEAQGSLSNQYYTDPNMGYTVNGTASNTDGQTLSAVNLYPQNYGAIQQGYPSEDYNHNITGYSQDMNSDPFKPHYEYDPASQGQQTLIYNNTDSGLGYETNNMVYNGDISMSYYHDNSITQYNHSQPSTTETSPTIPKKKKTPGPKKTPIPGDKPFICETCFKPLCSLQSLRKHMITHTGFRQFKCDLCGNSYTQKHNLTKHLRVHSGERPYSCLYCPSAYRTSHLLKNHMNKHPEYHASLDEKSNDSELAESSITQTDSTEMSDASFQDSENNNSLLEADDPDRFIMKDDDDEKSHNQSDVSADKIDDQSKLSDREAVLGMNVEDSHAVNQSTVADNLKCDQCDQTFESRVKLITHKNEHSGKKQLSCNICSATFRWKASLEIHMRKHKNDKGKKQPSYELKGLKIKNGNMISLKIVNSEKKSPGSANTNGIQKSSDNVKVGKELFNPDVSKVGIGAGETGNSGETQMVNGIGQIGNSGVTQMVNGTGQIGNSGVTQMVNGTGQIGHSEVPKLVNGVAQTGIPRVLTPRKRGRPKKIFSDEFQTSFQPTTYHRPIIPQPVHVVPTITVPVTIQTIQKHPNEVFRNVEALKSKPTNHPRKFSCDSCGQKFTQNYSLKRHLSNSVCTR